VVHACNPRTWEDEAERECESSLGYIARHCLKKEKKKEEEEEKERHLGGRETQQGGSTLKPGL
jgi:hypothetical protein